MIRAAVSGLGFSEISRAEIGSATTLAVSAARRAMADAGIGASQVDGLLVTHSPVLDCHALGMDFQRTLGLDELQLLEDVHGQGASSAQMLEIAARAIGAGEAEHVLCVFADAMLSPEASAGQAYAIALPQGEIEGWEAAHGLFGAHAAYAMACRRHMEEYGTTTEHLGSVAVAARRWASGNPTAMLRSPMTLADHQDSPWVVQPFRRFDCAFPVNGGVAVLVSRYEAARDLAREPVLIAGCGRAHAVNPRRAGGRAEVESAAGAASARALERAGLSLQEIDVCEIYDCFTYATLVLLEDLGFCGKGEGGPFVAEGNIEPGGAIPTNTGGGQLSGYYLQGMTPISEAIIQLRGDGGVRQVTGAETALVACQGGVLEHHASLVLSTDNV
jgi:acetyl-CoA acetyltransferase